MGSRNKIRLAAAVMTMMLAFRMSGMTACAEEQQPDSIFTEEEQAYIEAAEPLKVGYVRDRKPVSFQDENGELAGISRGIFDRISGISGLKFEYIELPAGDVTYDYLLSEGFDFVTGVEYNKENQKAHGILMSDPYLSSRKVIVAKDGTVIEPEHDLTVAISTGSQTIRKVLKDQYPNFITVDYDTTEACFDAVSRGEVDLLIQNQYVAEYWLYKPVYDNLRVIPVLDLADQLCFSAVTSLEPSEAEWHQKELMVDIINRSIASMSDSEVSAYVIAATMGNMYEYTFQDVLYQYRYTFAVLGIAVISICFLLYLNMHIRIQSIKAQANAKAKGDFLSTMSHEIRTPLNGLISLNYLMERNVNDADKISNYLQQSSSVARYLLSLVNNILDMSKLQESEITLEHKPVDLNLLLETVESVEKGAMEEKGLQFLVDAQIPYPYMLGDEVRIQQILVNVIDNARKYTDQGGYVTVKVFQEKLQEGEVRTTIKITDTGRGMSEEFQKKIFDPFTQERTTVSQGNQGTSLGMAICALLAERMNGSLKVKSRLNEGSCFTFTFTARQTEPGLEERQGSAAPGSEKVTGDAQNASGEKQIQGTAAAAGRPNILIAEDNELNGQILVELLTEEGFEVQHVNNGKKAVEAFASSAIGKYGVILMDVMMPEMDGLQAAAAIRALDRPDAGKVTIIACTANSFKEDQNKALESGMNDFVTKPIDVQKLIRKIEECTA